MPGNQTHPQILLGSPKLRDRRALIGAPAEQETTALSHRTTRTDNHGGIFPERMVGLITVTPLPEQMVCVEL